jgi:hypothetical protein
VVEEGGCTGEGEEDLNIDTDCDGNRMVRDVPAWCNAKRILQDELGIDVTDVRVQPIIVPDWLHEPKSKGWVHCHFFGKDGREVAYFTVGLNVVFVFNNPRVWDSEIFAKAAYPS